MNLLQGVDGDEGCLSGVLADRLDDRPDGFDVRVGCRGTLQAESSAVATRLRITCSANVVLPRP